MITGEQISGFTTERKPARRCYIVVGNHGTYHGIGEILYTLHHFFSRRYTVYFSLSVIPDNLNIIIDEFANQELPQYLAECKRNRPKTRFVIVATEFVTEISVAGINFGNTFNYFNFLDDWKHVLHILMYRYGLKSRPPYMYARYLGFVAALGSADLVLCVHPLIRQTMALIPEEANVHAAELLDIYPEVDVDKITSDRRLIDLPAGFVSTGTLTKYRAKLIAKLRETFTRADIPGQVHQHLPFGKSPGFTIVNQAIKFEYDEAPNGAS